MVVAKANGEFRISPQTSGAEFTPFLVNAEFNYFRDDYGDDPIGAKSVTVDDVGYVEPIAMRAYQEYLEEPGKDLYNRFDYGLIGQVGVYPKRKPKFPREGYVWARRLD